VFKYSLTSIIKILFNSKFIFTKPPKKKIMVYDSESKEIINFFNQKDLHIFDVRHQQFSHQKINLFIIFKLLIEFKLSKKNYIFYYFKYVNPKAVITLIDNNISFYKLKKIYPYCKFIAVQNAFRTSKVDIFSDLKNLKKKKNKLFCDYILTFNKDVGRLYNSFITCKILTIGSIRSNKRKKIENNKKHDIMYISTYRSKEDNEIFLKNPLTTFGEYRKKEIDLINNLHKYCLKNKLQFSILGAKINLKEEAYFKNLIGNKKITFIPRTENRETYKIIDSSKIIVNTDSTLGYEAASRGNKVAFFHTRGNKGGLISSRFGWPSKKKLCGDFWSNQVDDKTIQKLMSFLSQKNQIVVKRKIKSEMNNILIFDYKNTRFKRFLRNKVI
jgi:surface carbohydrate biosynthesis protein